MLRNLRKKYEPVKHPMDTWYGYSSKAGLALNFSLPLSTLATCGTPKTQKLIVPAMSSGQVNVKKETTEKKTGFFSLQTRSCKLKFVCVHIVFTLFSLVMRFASFCTLGPLPSLPAAFPPSFESFPFPSLPGNIRCCLTRFIHVIDASSFINFISL